MHYGDGRFPLFFVKTTDYVALKISAVFHKLVRAGGFSKCWRLGNITHVSKSGSASSCLDYVPVTITLVLSKDCKHLSAKCLNTFSVKNNLIRNLHYGFCKGLGACDALQTITNFVQKALDSC